jgi:hypothetical protein
VLTITAPDGATFAVDLVVPEPADPIAAASWLKVANHCDPPAAVVRYLGPEGYSSLTTPPTPAAVAPALTLGGSWLTFTPTPTGNDVKAELLPVVADNRAKYDRGAMGRAEVRDVDGSGVRFVLAGEANPLTAATAVLAALNVKVPLPSGYPSGSPPYPSDVTTTPAGAPEQRIVTTLTLRNEFRYGARAFEGASLRLPTATSASTGDRVLFPTGLDAAGASITPTAPGAVWRAGTVA